MVFATAVAGPSRLPYLARPLARAAVPLSVRRYAKTAEEPVPGEAEQPPLEGDASAVNPDAEIADLDASGEMVSMSLPPQKPGDRPGYERWLVTVGKQFQRPARGRKALWIGDDVPYPSNPSFRPPPPLSNDLMDIIAAELAAGKFTVGQIAQRHNVSKARIEAIRKLKMVESEFVRQGLPLQTAFQSEMETLLGVRSPLNAATKAPSIDAARAEETARAHHPSTQAEQNEEWIHEHSQSHGGAFANAWEHSHNQGVKREAWQFKSEKEVVAERIAKAHEKPAPVVHREEAKEKPARLVKPAKTVYRFIDTTKEKK